MGSPQQFGGDWTRHKLALIKKYLEAYMQILPKRSHLRVAYIDGFAGSGAVQLRGMTQKSGLEFTELEIEETQSILKGSVRTALEVLPRFDKYIFIDRKRRNVEILNVLKGDYPDVAERISIKHGDANEIICDLCAKDWSSRRAVLFLDPYGMQVEWSTLETIAHTEAIDLWILFPCSAVNRLLRIDGKLDRVWRRRLDLLFGTSEWVDVFYTVQIQPTLFEGEQREVRKCASFDKIAHFFVSRLKTIFPLVSEAPKYLCTSSGHRLFLLCFAAANPRAPVALKIANDILQRV